MLIVLPILLFVALSTVLSIIPELGAKDYPNFSEPNKVSMMLSFQYLNFSSNSMALLILLTKYHDITKNHNVR